MIEIKPTTEDVNRLLGENPDIDHKLKIVTLERMVTERDAQIATLKTRVGELEAGAQKTNGIAREMPEVSEKK